MSSVPAAFRSVILYLILVPLAVVLGYMLTTPLQWSSFGMVGMVLLILALPLLLRFHHPLLILGWNCTMIVFFMPGAPNVWLPLVAISLTVSMVQRTIDQDFRFISVPSLTWSLLAIGAVALITAEATGGIHMRSTGGDLYGGKRYILLLMAVVGYFAITAQRVPTRRAGLYISLFLLGGATVIIGDALYVNSPAVRWLYWFFPPSGYLGREYLSGLYRFSGICRASTVLFMFMLAKYGVRGIFAPSRPWRLALFAFFAVTSLLGGFRSVLVHLAVVFAILFCLEGLHRTKLLPILLVSFVLTASIALPFTKSFPYSIQRTLSFLPVPVSQAARMDAQASTEWRLQMWKAVLPQVQEYLLLGKGLAIRPQDYGYMVNNYLGNMSSFTPDQDWAALAGDYHSGPLSLTIPFGIWGDFAFIWFLIAASRVLYRNYRYGDPDLRLINNFLLAVFLAKIFSFLFVAGGFYSDMQIFVGYVALSVCLNGGMARRVPEAVPETSEATQVRDFAPNPRPVFGRVA